uniref:Uncharacterized protein n=1 Tax=Leersia perrieri TaxID=77586 RepID=A0A0D9WJA9_9ORYZ
MAGSSVILPLNTPSNPQRQDGDCDPYFDSLVDSFITAAKTEPKQSVGSIDYAAAGRHQAEKYARSALDYYNRDENNKVVVAILSLWSVGIFRISLSTTISAMLVVMQLSILKMEVCLRLGITLTLRRCGGLIRATGGGGLGRPDFKDAGSPSSIMTARKSTVDAKKVSMVSIASSAAFDCNNVCFDLVASVELQIGMDGDAKWKSMRICNWSGFEELLGELMPLLSMFQKCLRRYKLLLMI